MFPLTTRGRPGIRAGRCRWRCRVPRHVPCRAQAVSIAQGLAGRSGAWFWHERAPSSRPKPPAASRHPHFSRILVDQTAPVHSPLLRGAALLCHSTPLRHGDWTSLRHTAARLRLSRVSSRLTRRPQIGRIRSPVRYDAARQAVILASRARKTTYVTDRPAATLTWPPAWRSRLGGLCCSLSDVGCPHLSRTPVVPSCRSAATRVKGPKSSSKLGRMQWRTG